MARARIFLILALAVVVLANGACTNDEPPKPEMVPVPAAIVPDPPAFKPPTGPAEKRTAALADAFEQRGEARAAALLNAFALAGLPVVDGQERPLTTAGDRVGMNWSTLWMVGVVPEPHARVPLSSLATLFTADGSGRLDAAKVADRMLAGLRAALKGDAAKPGVTPIALLVREEARRARGVDLADPAVRPRQVYLTVPTATLLVSAGLLSAIANADRASLASAPKDVVPVAYRVGGQAAPFQCTPDDAVKWAMWITKRVSTGVKVPGIGRWEGLFKELLEYVIKKVPDPLTPELKAVAERVGDLTKLAGYAAAALTALTTLIGVLTISADVKMSGTGPLVRTLRTTVDGEIRDLDVTVKYDYGKLPPEVLRGINCLLIGLSLVGNTATLPNPGGISGSVVNITGGVGFGERLNTKGAYMIFPDYREQRAKTTGPDGHVTFQVAGRHQVREVDEKANKVERPFSVLLTASLDPSNGSKLARAFLDSFLCGGGLIAAGAAKDAVVACVSAVSDVIKQFDWDVGEFFFKVLDRQPVRNFTFEGRHTWRHQGTDPTHPIDSSGNVRFTGEMVCIPDDRSWACTGEMKVTGSGAFYRIGEIRRILEDCIEPWSANQTMAFEGFTNSTELTGVPLNWVKRGGPAMVCDHYAPPVMPLDQTLIQGSLFLPPEGRTEEYVFDALDIERGTEGVRNGTVEVTVTSTD